ncbi:hypothetical protein KBD59_03630 [Candidatus Gracilibacteria bacterium]|nr:hypothetical protein [Candidatus Gracilibacteria bacterium]
MSETPSELGYSSIISGRQPVKFSGVPTLSHGPDMTWDQIAACADDDVVDPDATLEELDDIDSSSDAGDDRLSSRESVFFIPVPRGRDATKANATKWKAEVAELRAEFTKISNIIRSNPKDRYNTAYALRLAEGLAQTFNQRSETAEAAQRYKVRSKELGERLSLIPSSGIIHAPRLAETPLPTSAVLEPEPSETHLPTSVALEPEPPAPSSWGPSTDLFPELALAEPAEEPIEKPTYDRPDSFRRIMAEVAAVGEPMDLFGQYRERLEKITAVSDPVTQILMIRQVLEDVSPSSAQLSPFDARFFESTLSSLHPNTRKIIEAIRQEPGMSDTDVRVRYGDVLMAMGSSFAAETADIHENYRRALHAACNEAVLHTKDVTRDPRMTSARAQTEMTPIFARAELLLRWAPAGTTKVSADWVDRLKKLFEQTLAAREARSVAPRVELRGTAVADAPSAPRSVPSIVDNSALLENIDTAVNGAEITTMWDEIVTMTRTINESGIHSDLPRLLTESIRRVFGSGPRAQAAEKMLRIRDGQVVLDPSQHETFQRIPAFRTMLTDEPITPLNPDIKPASITATITGMPRLQVAPPALEPVQMRGVSIENPAVQRETLPPMTEEVGEPLQSPATLTPPAPTPYQRIVEHFKTNGVYQAPEMPRQGVRGMRAIFAAGILALMGSVAANNYLDRPVEDAGEGYRPAPADIQRAAPEPQPVAENYAKPAPDRSLPRAIHTFINKNEAAAHNLEKTLENTSAQEAIERQRVAEVVDGVDMLENLEFAITGNERSNDIPPAVIASFEKQPEQKKSFVRRAFNWLLSMKQA